SETSPAVKRSMRPRQCARASAGTSSRYDRREWPVVSVTCSIQRATVLNSLPLPRCLISLAVLYRPEPLLAGIRALRPSVMDAAAAAMCANLRDDQSASVAAHVASAPIVRLSVRAIRFIRIERDCVPLLVNPDLDDIVILSDDERLAIGEYVDPDGLVALAPVTGLDVLACRLLGGLGGAILDLGISVRRVIARQDDDGQRA